MHLGELLWVLILHMVHLQNTQKEPKADKVLKDKAFEIASNPKYDGYQRGLASMVYKFFNSKSKGAGIKNRIKENQGEFNSGNLHSKLANDLQ